MRKSLPILVTFLVIASITGAAIAADTTASGSTPAGVVNINTADAAQLSLLPRVGQKAAARIIEYRTAHGPFQTAPCSIHVNVCVSEAVEAVSDHAVCDG